MRRVHSAAKESDASSGTCSAFSFEPKTTAVTFFIMKTESAVASAAQAISSIAKQIMPDVAPEVLAQHAQDQSARLGVFEDVLDLHGRSASGFCRGIHGRAAEAFK